MPRTFGAWLGLSLLAHAATFTAVVRGNRAATAVEDAQPASPSLTGDTLEFPGLEAVEESTVDLDLDTEPTPVARLAAASADDTGARPRMPPPRARSKIVLFGAPNASASTDPSPPERAEPARFGAVGERGSVDLATAFTRGFPQPASADPVWTKAPFGSAGTIEVILSLDESGHLVEARLEPGGTPALRQALIHTIALVRGRTFTARKATTRLRVSAIVTADAVRNDSKSGDVYALGASYAKSSGTAFFSLAVGRRIDVTFTER